MSYQKFTKDVSIVGLTQLAMILKTIILLPIITKLLGTENYGIWAQLIVTVSLLTPIAVLGLPYALVRFLAGEKNKEEIQDGVYSSLTLILIVALIISIALKIFSKSLAGFWGVENNLIDILALTIIFTCLNSVFLNVFRFTQRISRFSLFTIFQALGEVGLVVMAIFLGLGLYGAVLSLLIIRILNFLFMGAFVIKEIGIRVPKFKRIKEYLSFGLPTIPSNISFWVVRSSDRYLINYFLGPLFVGYYAPAYIIGTSMDLIAMSLSFILPVVLSKYYDEKNIVKVKNYLTYCLKYFLSIAIPAAFGLSLLSKQLLTIFSTSDIANQSHFVIPFVALRTILFGVYIIFLQTIILSKKTKVIGTIWTIAALLNFGLNLIFIPVFGILGAAITTLFVYTIVLIKIRSHSQKNLVVKIEWNFILKSFIAAIAMSLLIILINPHGLSRLIITVIFSIFIYFLSIILLKGFKEKEILFFRNLLKDVIPWEM